MIDCYITKTAAFLPGAAVENDAIERHLGSVGGDTEIRDQVLALNGIKQRYYAQNDKQQQTYNLYELASQAVSLLNLEEIESAREITYLSAGTTYAPLAAPGFASILHDHLRHQSLLDYPVEISSHAGICTSGAAAMVSAIRAINSGYHKSALCVSAEQPSAILKASAITPVDDRSEHNKLRNSQWFMSVFLRYMLSDGAGAIMLRDTPTKNGVSLRVN